MDVSGRLFLILISILFSVGCNSRLGKSYEVSGKITKGEKPVAGATVVFQCVSEMPAKYRTVRGKTDASGQYKLRKVYAGSYEVEILEAGMFSTPGGSDQDFGEEPALPGNAVNVEPRKAEVAEGKTNFDFDLKHAQ